MATNETSFTITTDTVSEGDFTVGPFDGQFEVSLAGNFDGATVAYNTFSSAFSRGAPTGRTAATAADSFTSVSRWVELQVSAAGGSTAIEVVARPLLGNGVQGA